MLYYLFLVTYKNTHQLIKKYIKPDGAKKMFPQSSNLQDK